MFGDYCSYLSLDVVLVLILFCLLRSLCSFSARSQEGVGKKFCGLGSFGDVVWRLLCGSPILYVEKGNL